MSLNAEIQDYMQAIKSALDTIDDLVDDSSNYYSSSTYLDFVSKKANLKLSKDNIIANVNSYIDDYNYIVSLLEKKNASNSETIIESSEIIGND